MSAEQPALAVHIDADLKTPCAPDTIAKLAAPPGRTALTGLTRAEATAFTDDQVLAVHQREDQTSRREAAGRL